MNVWFLGTGTSQGIPIIGSTHPVCLSTDQKDKRLRASVWISWPGHSYVIDCGPDFRQQMLASGCTKLDGILYTHEHSDHTAGLDDIRPFFFRQGNIPLYASRRVLNNLRLRFDYIFSNENKYPGAPSVTVNEVLPYQSFQLGNKTATAFTVLHGDLEIFGYRIEDFAYVTDAKHFPQQSRDLLQGVKVLVVSALRVEPHESHFNLEEALAFIETVKPERTYLTHISHMMGFHEEVQKILPKRVFLAYDNLQITV